MSQKTELTRITQSPPQTVGNTWVLDNGERVLAQWGRRYFGGLVISETMVSRPGDGMKLGQGERFLNLQTGVYFRREPPPSIRGYFPEVNITIFHIRRTLALWDGRNEPVFIILHIDDPHYSYLYTPKDGVKFGEVTMGNGMKVERLIDRLVIPGFKDIGLERHDAPRIINGKIIIRKPSGCDEIIDLNEFDWDRIFLLQEHFKGVPLEIWDRIFLFLKTYF